MFISSARPLADTRVRLEDGREFELDDAGRTSVVLQPGTHQVEVRSGGQWISKTIDVKPEDKTLVVDVDDDPGSGSTGLVGQTLGGRYHIEAALGQGGMGTVYRARDLRLERPVAIKTLSEQLRANEEASRMFLQEARQMAPLSHPHLVSVYDVTTLEGHELMVTELVEGHSLEKWLGEQGPLNIDAAAVIGYQMAIAVAFLHEQNTIHRDLKPANAVLEDGGGVKLIDFGLARSLQKLMVKGTAVRGTPAYMAPEQVTDEGPGPPTDVYQLGATLYELLTGQLPVDPEGESMIAYATESHDPITAHRRDLDEPLVDLIHACLHQEPESRPTAEQLADRLARVYYGRNSQRPPSQLTPGNWSPPPEDAFGATNGDASDASQNDPPAFDGPDNPTGGDADFPQHDDGDGEPSPAGESSPHRSHPHTAQTPGDPTHPSPPGKDLPGRDPDFTGAGGSSEVEWNRPVARVALITVIAAILLVLVMLTLMLVTDPPDREDQPETPGAEQIDDDPAAPSGAEATEPELDGDVEELGEELARSVADATRGITEADGVGGEPADQPDDADSRPEPPAHEPDDDEQLPAAVDERGEAPDDPDEPPQQPPEQHDEAVEDVGGATGEPEEAEESEEPDELEEAEEPEEPEEPEESEELEEPDEPEEPEEPDEPEEPEEPDELEEPEEPDEPEEPEQPDDEDDDRPSRGF